MLPPVGHIPALDGIRGLAIIAVMVYHFMNLVPVESGAVDLAFSKICDAGWIGVDLFFVLSGFLITGILLDTKGRTHYFRTFYARRFLRIFPLYYGILVALFVLLPLALPVLPEALNQMRQDQWWYWSYLLNWKVALEGGFGDTLRGGYLWSLAVEEQFYLLWPPIVLFLSRRTLMILVCVAFAASAILRGALLAAGVEPDATYAITFTHMDGMLVGALIATALRTGSLGVRQVRWFRWSACASAAVLLAVFAWLGEFNFYDAPVAAVGSSCLAIVFGYALLASLGTHPSNFWHRLLRSQTVRTFGRYSYCIYLIHSPVAAALKHYVYDPSGHAMAGFQLPAALGFVILASAACWCLAIASWHLYERQFLALKRFFEPREASTRVGSADASPPVIVGSAG